MKYDPQKKLNRNTQRTLKAFSEAMFGLLGEKNFEKITVNELCARCDYPRATFYNYFDDKYDLVSYCWYQLGKDAHLDAAQTLPTNESLLAVFDEVYRLFTTHHDLLNRVVEHNPVDGLLINDFIHHFNRVMTQLFANSLLNHKTKTPIELMAQYYSNTVLLVLKWVFLSQHDVSLDTARGYLTELLTKPFLSEANN
ncbi:TetR/AcrR family transcriptional regulator [Lacticaseibacillus manihotivorans]|uniref:Transcriptional regulator, TetR family n=3 Tax=Lacticaseibacillus manihotivorans TaxID=88233 RepID=A0A0R1Q016_9LACO|nr:TetR/AcrR family transcriptional regulator [Lacticaseibacillus manihotivorans]KRL37838.1 transcriptional regulator, TetR family [Lacticaseibacillus manihotivorans DSM 13343 = JCM 12514]QFQ91376.1 TetR family transcriptional regulator [Lacticaseibacillus manihotivorans]